VVIIGGVNAERLGRLARMLRVRQRLTQASLAIRAGASRRAVSDLECGHARRLRLAEVEGILAALGARLDLRILWNGPELDRLLDAGHAAIGASVKRRLQRWGWPVQVEVSFSRYGERGRIDLLAWHPLTGILLVVEIKTDLVNVQALLGSLDVKARLARHVAGSFGWRVTDVVPAIVFAEDRTTRNRLAGVAPLFDRYAVRGRAATSWLRRPDGAPSGLLWFTAGADRAASRSGAPRVRRLAS
jgi:transcriptional regulator with XRE-family HTH domain